MKLLHLATALAFFAGTAAFAADPPSPTLSAAELASRLSALRQDGASYIRLRLEIRRPAGTSQLQIQIKGRSTKAGTELVYQVLWPKERKGEAVLLRKVAGRPATGSLFIPPDTVRPLDASQMKEPLFDSDLSYEDVIENFFAWDRQTIVGTEVVDRANCYILESKPGKGDRSAYASVRTWVDVRRLVPLRIEKYLASGQLARRIDCTSVATDDIHRSIPANLTVRGRRPDSVTELDGSRIRHDVTYSDREFTPAGLQELKTPTSASQ